MVVPRVGAWIETRTKPYIRAQYTRSYPVWVRGLKQKQPYAFLQSV